MSERPAPPDAHPGGPPGDPCPRCDTSRPARWRSVAVLLFCLASTTAAHANQKGDMKIAPLLRALHEAVDPRSSLHNDGKRVTYRKIVDGQLRSNMVHAFRDRFKKYHADFETKSQSNSPSPYFFQTISLPVEYFHRLSESYDNGAWATTQDGANFQPINVDAFRQFLKSANTANVAHTLAVNLSSYMDDLPIEVRSTANLLQQGIRRMDFASKSIFNGDVQALIKEINRRVRTLGGDEVVETISDVSSVLRYFDAMDQVFSRENLYASNLVRNFFYRFSLHQASRALDTLFDLAETLNGLRHRLHAGEPNAVSKVQQGLIQFGERIKEDHSISPLAQWYTPLLVENQHLFPSREGLGDLLDQIWEILETSVPLASTSRAAAP